MSDSRVQWAQSDGPFEADGGGAGPRSPDVHAACERMAITFATQEGDAACHEAVSAALWALSCPRGLLATLDEQGLSYMALGLEPPEAAAGAMPWARLPLPEADNPAAAALRERRPIASETSREVPTGGPVLQRSLVVPLCDEAGVVGLLIAGDKATLWDASDEETARTLSTCMAPALRAHLARVARRKARHNAIDALRAAVEDSQRQVNQRTADLVAASGRMLEEAARRESIAHVLRSVAEGVSAPTGDAFFRFVTQHLATNLGAHYAWVGEYLDGGRVRAIVCYGDGVFRDGFEYDPTGTPCGTVGRRTICSYPRDVRTLFPESRLAAELGIESFVGASLKTSDGRPAGLLVVVGRDPIENPEVAEWMVELLAVRVAAELERRHGEQRERRHEQQLRSLSTALAIAEERERRRFARDLHEQVGQLLEQSASMLDAMGEGQPDTGRTLTEACRLLERAIASTRSLTLQISSPILYEIGFESAIEWLVEQMEKEHGLRADFYDDGADKPLTRDVAVVLYQAVRELLHNVARHSQARRASVTLSRAGDMLEVVVEDDGVGFTLGDDGGAEGTEGFGLFGVRERVEHLGGEVVVDTEPGQGTRVELRAPLSSRESKQ